MIKSKYTLLYILLLGVIILTGCSDHLFSDEEHGENRILLAGDIEQMAVTRVNDNGFCNGDEMGIYVVDYEGDYPGTLKVSGNRGDNVRHTFDETNNKWNSAYDLYWKDKHTHIDIYGYYPYANPESIEDYAFEVQKDQSKASAGGSMGGYEASDFLWGKVADVAPTTSVIRLPLSHRMSNARVTLVQGSGFTPDEWNSTEKIVLTTNVARKANINLSKGEVKVNGSIESTATIPSRNNDEWRTIVIPQTIPAGTTLFSITIGGVPYKFTKNEDFTYQAGKMMNFGIRVDKQSASGQYKLTLISESITPWENDLVSHDATAREYIVIHSTAGHLKEAIAAANKDYTQVKNLKITGEINFEDFMFMRNEMTKLSALNIQEVKIAYTPKTNGQYDGHSAYPADEIPDFAFLNSSLTHIILPNHIKAIGTSSFNGCKYLTGSLTIPEGVETLGPGAFNDCTSLDGTLTLPSTLKKIDSSFWGCSSLTGNLVLPNNLEVIDDFAFYGCSNFYGDLHLPSSLKSIGYNSFAYCGGLTGSLEIPQNITEIPQECFIGCGFNGNLTLKNGMTKIGQDAFSGCHFIGELSLPKTLKVIEKGAFTNNHFSGSLALPQSLISIGEIAFAYNDQLSGALVFPNEMTSIQGGAFAGCSNLTSIVIPANNETIGSSAFRICI